MFFRKKNKESITRLVNNLEHLCVHLENVCCINCGGCGFVAYCIAENLEKYNISYEIVFHGISDSWKNRRHFKKALLNNCCETVSHVSIKIGDNKINIGQYRKSIRDYGHIIGKIPSENIRTWYYKNLKLDNWNSTYDIRCNGVVHREINKLFKIYEKESCSNRN